jgi:hypothetical protein
MASIAGNPAPSPQGSTRVTRLVWHTIGLVLAALVAWAVWRGYQNPDFVLDLAAWRLC